ncbi:MAG: hypothetical protein MMC23_001340 [Stictis urceolatum]|nr:hypothetical protein [Stictis urceolata]
MPFNTSKPGEGNDHAGRELVTSAFVMGFLSCSAVALRFVSRKIQRVPLMHDDWLILAALPFAIGLCTIDVAGFFYSNFGKHTVATLPASVRGFLISTWVFQILYDVAVSLPKLSMLALYWRVFGLSAFKWPLLVTAGVTWLFMISMVLTSIFSCNPVHGFWDLFTHSKCIDQLSFYIGQSVCNMTIDMTLLLLPIIPVRRLNIPLSQKIAVIIIFFLGIFVTISSAIRLKVLVGIAKSKKFDLTFSLVGASVWSVVEANLSIVCVCLPSMRPLLRKMINSNTRYPNTRSQATGSTQSVSSRFSKYAHWPPFNTRANASRPWQPMRGGRSNDAIKIVRVMTVDTELKTVPMISPMGYKVSGQPASPQSPMPPLVPQKDRPEKASMRGKR